MTFTEAAFIGMGLGLAFGVSALAVAYLTKPTRSGRRDHHVR